MASKNKRLRTGYTTGACAAAAAKAATLLLLRGQRSGLGNVDIPFPDGSRHEFGILNSGYSSQYEKAYASVIKDAGDDPDITNRAEIRAEAKLQDTIYREGEHRAPVLIKGGKGIGRITKPGLPVPVGEPAINPVPRRMIREAVAEAVGECGLPDVPLLEITVSVPEGESLAKKTLNGRLGITGGISILGTSGIVRPISSEAWTASITAAMDVARAMGHSQIVLSAGRSSESAHIRRYSLPEDMYVMMGDYLEFSLLEARRHGFQRVCLCAQWAKMLKIAMSTPQTHVRHGAIDMGKTVMFLKNLWQISLGDGHEFNTAMEIFQFINTSLKSSQEGLLLDVCRAAKHYAEKITEGIPVTCYLVSYEREVIAESD